MRSCWDWAVSEVVPRTGSRAAARRCSAWSSFRWATCAVSRTTTRASSGFRITNRTMSGWRRKRTQHGRKSNTRPASRLVYRTGGLDLGPVNGAIPLSGYAEAMRTENVSFETLDAEEIRRRWPAFRIGEDVRGLYQADGGIVAAEPRDRRAPAVGVRSRRDTAATTLRSNRCATTVRRSPCEPGRRIFVLENSCSAQAHGAAASWIGSTFGFRSKSPRNRRSISCRAIPGVFALRTFRCGFGWTTHPSTAFHSSANRQ